jgi:hypothetical protein
MHAVQEDMTENDRFRDEKSFIESSRAIELFDL